MKKLLAIIISVIMLMSFCSCKKESEEPIVLKKGDVIEMKATKDGVEEFYKEFQESQFFKLMKQAEYKLNKLNFYNITPEDSEEKTGNKVFYDIENGNAFIFDGVEIIGLELDLEHLHTPSVVDLNNDGYYEYVTCVLNKSDTNRQVLSVFDLKTKSKSVIATSLTSNHIVSAVSKDGKCYIYYSEPIMGDESDAKITIGGILGEIKYSEDKNDGFNNGFYFENMPTEEE